MVSTLEGSDQCRQDKRATNIMLPTRLDSTSGELETLLLVIS